MQGDPGAPSTLYRRPLPANRRSKDKGSDLLTKFLTRKESFVKEGQQRSHKKYRKYSRGSLNCLRPLGPDFFPKRLPKKMPDGYFKQITYENQFNFPFDSQYLNHEAEIMPQIVTEKPFNVEVEEKDRSFKILNLHQTESLPEIPTRKPWRQVLLEEQFYEFENEVFKKCPNTTPDHASDDDDLYTVGSTLDIQQYYNEKLEADYLPEESITSDLSNKLFKHFPEDLFENENEKTYTENYSEFLTDEQVSVESVFLNDEETKLNLKSYFLDVFPDLSHSLFDTLTSINISFNDFVDIPEQLYFAKHLISLNMRNNPLTIISDGIKKLVKLKYVNFSFCYLFELNKSLFCLRNLEILDLSYNHISIIDKDIQKLICLRELLLDGNCIRAFPPSILELNLANLHCNSNFIHQLFWKETVPPIPQNLFDIASTYMAQNDLLWLAPNLHAKVKSYDKCGYCNSVKACEGIPVLKPVAEVFNVRDLPLIFYVCSQTCKRELTITSNLPRFDELEDA